MCSFGNSLIHGELVLAAPVGIGMGSFAHRIVLAACIGLSSCAGEGGAPARGGANVRGGRATAALGADGGSCGERFELAGPRVFPVLGEPRDMVALDVDGDGLPDLVTLSVNETGATQLEVLRNLGAKRFAVPIVSGAAGVDRIVSADFDGDGHVDLAAWSSSGDVRILRNAGSGAFVSGPIVATGLGAGTPAAADIDGDGTVDLVGAGASGIRFFRNDGSGAFGAAIDLPVGGTWQYVEHSVAVGDLDGDGTPDLAIAAFQVLSVLRGQGAGAFGPPTDYHCMNCHNPGSNVIIGDVNGDGHPDVLTGQGNSDAAFAVFLNHGDGTLAAAAGHQPAGPIALVDLDHDGVLDVFVGAEARHNGAAFSVLRNRGGADFARAVSSRGLRSARTPALADFDGDGWLDVAGFHDVNTVAVLFARPGGGFDAGPNGVLDLIGHDLPGSTARGDLDGDGITDLVLANGSVRVLRGDAAGGFSAAGVYAPIQYPYPAFQYGASVSLAVADLDGDGDSDVVMLTSFFASTDYDYPAALVVFRNHGDGTLEALPPVRVWGSPQGPIAVGDVDGDGDADVVVGEAFGVEVVTNDGHGILSGAPCEGACVAQWKGEGMHPSIAGPRYLQVDSGQGALVGDIDGDGALDIVSLGPRLTVIRNDGAGGFDQRTAYDVPGGGWAVARLGDVDGDGLPDLVSATFTGVGGVLLNRGGGTFAAAIRLEGVTTPAPSAYGYLAPEIALGDIDGDGRIDVAMLGARGTVARDTTVDVFLNQGGGVFAPSVAYAAGSALDDYSYMLANLGLELRDRNGDGWLDVVAGGNVLYGRAPCGPTIQPPRVGPDGGVEAGTDGGAEAGTVIADASSGEDGGAPVVIPPDRPRDDAGADAGGHVDAASPPGLGHARPSVPASSPPAHGPTAATSASPAASDSEGTGGCAIGAPRQTANLAPALLAIAALTLRRRRRAPSPRAGAPSSPQA